MPQAVAIFSAAFADELAPLFGRPAHTNAMLEVWRFVRSEEPAGFFAARIADRVVGYAIFVRSLRRIQRRALTSGALAQWIWHFARGRSRVQLRGIARAALNKTLFLRGGSRFRTAGDAQLLNVAVDRAFVGRGIARALVAEGLAYLGRAGVPEVRLEVRPWNEAARRVYQATGWSEVARTADAIGPWIVMTARPAQG